MKTDLSQIIDPEISQIGKKLTDIGIKKTDEAIFEKEMPFTIHKDISNEAYKNKLSFVIYPEILHYNENSEKSFKYVSKIWLAVEMTFEGIEDPYNPFIKKVVKNIIDDFKKIGLEPFFDEDAPFGHLRYKKGGGYIEVMFFVNPDYPDGVWSNHALE